MSTRYILFTNIHMYVCKLYLNCIYIYAYVYFRVRHHASMCTRALQVCMCIQIAFKLYLNTCIGTYANVFVCVRAWLCVCLRACGCGCMCGCACAYICVCVCVRVSVRVRVRERVQTLSPSSTYSCIWFMYI